VLVVNQQDAERALAMPAAITAMRDVLLALDEGRAVQPLRSSFELPGTHNRCWLMPACAGSPTSLGVKVLTAFHGNTGTRFDAHQGAVLLFGEHGELLALIDATAITALRTAAVSAVATDILARPNATRLAILGSGAQARSHLEAMACVRPIAHVRVWSRNAAHAERFAKAARERCAIDIDVSENVHAAVRDADIICAATAAQAAIMDVGMVQAGAHINAVGSGSPAHRELSSEVVRNARVYVDRLESALLEAGDIVLAIADGTIAESHIVGEIGAVLAGRVQGRRSAGEITLFKSVGLGVEDVAAASVILAECQARGFGTRVPFGADLF
jgi:ornithine cyclodeaminase/alanine dehydrogenase-like protein (mu-crystallin family)